MKCIRCGQVCEYVYNSMSLCEEHLIQFQQNTLINQPARLTPVLNQPSIIDKAVRVAPTPKGREPDTPQPNIPLSPAKKKATQFLAEYTQWKGRKKPKSEGGYYLADGTWGWDFTDQFPPDIVTLVRSEPVVVGDYVYETNEVGTTITKRKAKS